ncbi:hypothetical protein ACLOJK_011643 [Asimina triloba]
MPHRDVVSWNARVAGYAQNGMFDEALDLCKEMDLDKVKPDAGTMASILPAVTSTDTANVVFMRKIFDNMAHKGLVSWNAMIAIYVNNFMAAEAMQLFLRMEAEMVDPDAVTLASILPACGDLFKTRMIKKVDLEDKGNFIKKMPIGPNERVCGALLGACPVYSKMDIGLVAADNLFKLVPEQSACYVLLSNIYAKAGRWDDVTSVRRIMKSKGIKKSPGCSNVELGNRVHTFVVGDRCHPQSKEIYAKLDSLVGKMKEVGNYSCYQSYPNFDHGQTALQGMASNSLSTNNSMSSSNVQKLCEIVSEGVGNLDDLEASLQELNINITANTITNVIDLCKTDAPSRRLLRFFSWSRKNIDCNKLGDDTFNHVIQICAEKKDLLAMHILISDLEKEHRSMDYKTFSCVVETFVKSGKEDDALHLFKNLDKFNCSKDRISLSIIVQALCSKGHAEMAERVVLRHRNKIPTEPCIYNSLLHGWCIHGNVKEVRRIVDEMKSLEICPTLLSYNAFLRCICNRNVKFNPSVLVPEATDLTIEMRTSGIYPTATTYNILLSSLSRTRRVKEACRLLETMCEKGCSPDWVSYYIVIRLLYLTGRFGRGNMLVNQMTEERLAPKARFYHDLIGVLCGVEKVGHALEIFERMKKSFVDECGPVYDMLIPKLCRGGEFNKGRLLWDEAVERGIVLQCSRDFLDPSKTEVFKPKGGKSEPRGSLENLDRTRELSLILEGEVRKYVKVAFEKAPEHL